MYLSAETDSAIRVAVCLEKCPIDLLWAALKRGGWSVDYNLADGKLLFANKSLGTTGRMRKGDPYRLYGGRNETVERAMGSLVAHQIILDLVRERAMITPVGGEATPTYWVDFAGFRFSISATEDGYLIIEADAVPMASLPSVQMLIDQICQKAGGLVDINEWTVATPTDPNELILV